jgi:MerR family transcriptional regulator/heat shock protein HspR
MPRQQAGCPGPAGRPVGPGTIPGVSVPMLPLDDEDLPFYTVGQVSQMLEIQQAFLRRLDEFSVVRPTRSSGGQRRYTRREILIVSYVVDLVDEGMTLAAIRRVLELEERVKDLEAERAVLRLAIAERDALISRLRGEKS